MKKIIGIILEKIGSIGSGVLFLSANTTSAWISHQPKVPEDIKKFKI